jgi:hypothetical protein
VNLKIKAARDRFAEAVRRAAAPYSEFAKGIEGAETAACLVVSAGAGLIIVANEDGARFGKEAGDLLLAIGEVADSAATEEREACIADIAAVAAHDFPTGAVRRGVVAMVLSKAIDRIRARGSK